MTSEMTTSLETSLQNRGVGINAPVSQERPVAASVFIASRIAFLHQNFFLAGALHQQLPERIGNKRMSPKFQSAFRAAFKAHAIDGGDKNAVGDGMGTLNGAPGIKLPRA